MPTKTFRFDPERPLWDVLHANGYATSSCLFCQVEFDEGSSKGTARISKAQHPVLLGELRST
ncbi:hypothetical protein [Bradyrhizobium elkanii]|uniref:Uncharacterized protein n=1 Tax=Bradyrhizobium elkanii TaxID=29448 RepID=A0ABV4FAD4_BRAEL|nr:hypothetical protein [Bradyrhizobium elkanii]MCP1751995.1 hypothetical protein [Bradyrhizobium elkanii]MCP1977766.1 hypothetical protein [Bradyrhizobium elkanii]MCS3887717.1 hypothetical protein [Bradyrhizobium elkanii]MCS4213264.1 hypothetical protein [Bradyrhizobium elkanii]MCW2213571.1 hypothetical protein [Bradyrhizobium elkanii]